MIGQADLPPKIDENGIIINSPTEPPEWHWGLTSDSRVPAGSQALGGRRQAQYIPAVAGVRNRGNMTRMLSVGIEDSFAFPPIEMVNTIRERVNEWRRSDYLGATTTSKRLIDHWEHLEESTGRGLYFAQMDAVLTHIWLREAADSDILSRLGVINQRYNDGIFRIAHKMATGSGKTVVMAMIVVYHTLNSLDHPEDNRFARNFLFLTPGITVRERLVAALSPEKTGNDYEEFALLPPGREDDLLLADVRVANRHKLNPETLPNAPGTKERDLIEGGIGAAMDVKETPEQAIERLIDTGGPETPVAVFNDEGHHCHRGKLRAPKNTDWFEGLKTLYNNGRLLYVTDMSATPVHLEEDNPPLFDWIISDYSLIDALEAGLTKMPSVPTVQLVNSSEPIEAKYRDIYSNTDSRQRRSFTSNPNNNQLLKEALEYLYKDYESALRDWEKVHAQDFGAATHPAMAIVINSISNAAAVFNYISGMEHGFIEFANWLDPDKTTRTRYPRTILVTSHIEEGSKVSGQAKTIMNELAEVYKALYPYHFQHTDSTEEVIRRTLNTVGKTGQPGEHIRCVVSVNMLTEGWDAHNVSHLVGFRKFGSQLLCEQVAGRTLRRVSHIRDDRGFYQEESAKILGVPFPQYAEPGKQGPDDNPKPVVTIHPRNAFSAYEVRWPNILQYRRVDSVGNITLHLDEFTDIEPVSVSKAATESFVLAAIADETVERVENQLYREEFLYQVAGEYTRRLSDKITVSDNQNGNVFRTTPVFAQSLAHIKTLLRAGKLIGPENADDWNSDDVPAITDWLDTHLAVKGVSIDTRPLLSVEGNKLSPWLYTSALRPYQVVKDEMLVYGETRKAHINYTHCDSSWETYLARALDNSDFVTKWARISRLPWYIPYIDEVRWQRLYQPDFLVVVEQDDGPELNIIIEVKGKARRNDVLKRQWARDVFVPGLNHHPEYGLNSGRRWSYLYLDNESGIFTQDTVDALRRVVEEHIECEKARGV